MNFPIGLTLPQVAKLVPNRSGSAPVHPMTIRRRVKRGEFPPPDITFEDGTLIWKRATLVAWKILPATTETTAAANEVA